MRVPVSFKIEREHKDDIEAKAKRQGHYLSSYVRKLILDDLAAPEPKTQKRSEAGTKKKSASA